LWLKNLEWVKGIDLPPAALKGTKGRQYGDYMKTLAKKMLRAGVPVPQPIRPLIRAVYQAGVMTVEVFALVRKVVWIEPVLKSVCESVGKGLRAECLPYMRGTGHLTLGENVYLSGRSCFYFMGGMERAPKIVVGDGTFIGNLCTLSAACRIGIGDHCLISTNVRIHDNDGHPLDPARRLRKEPILQEEAAEVFIGNNVWIGAHAMILKGVSIGDNAVIAAGAIVTHDVPANAVVAGNPARVVKVLGGAA
jgi:acetyltransferase-like isoleucine patch superfamily enzyme